MRYLLAILAATGMALPLAFTGLASAAPGEVVVTSEGGETKTHTAPQRGACLAGGGHNSTLANNTQGTILAFPDRACRTRVRIPVAEGEVRQGNIGSFRAMD